MAAEKLEYWSQKRRQLLENCKLLKTAYFVGFDVRL
jgi:hypothetical protein